MSCHFHPTDDELLLSTWPSKPLSPCKRRVATIKTLEQRLLPNGPELLLSRTLVQRFSLESEGLCYRPTRAAILPLQAGLLLSSGPSNDSPPSNPSFCNQGRVLLCRQSIQFPPLKSSGFMHSRGQGFRAGQDSSTQPTDVSCPPSGPLLWIAT